MLSREVTEGVNVEAWVEAMGDEVARREVRLVERAVGERECMAIEAPLEVKSHDS